MKLTFQQKLIGSFLVIFAIFTVGIVVFEQQRAKMYKTEALEERLDAYADAVSNYLSQNDADSLDRLLTLLPDYMRLTLIGRSGAVLFDNVVPDISALDSHFNRPEIASAIHKGKGSNIRTSASNDQPYLYYAKDIGKSTIIRVAMPYNVEVESFLKPDNAFLYFVVVLFLLGLGIIYSVGNHFGRSIRQLRDFSVTLNRGEATIPTFPKDELGEIGDQLVHDFNLIKEGETQLVQEREKLLQHVQASAEGICFFNPDRTVAFYNGLFLQYFNMISSQTLSQGSRIPDEETFTSTKEFLDEIDKTDFYETRIHQNGKEFLLRLNTFPDQSFEMILTDVTAQEKTRRLKQEMTGNIAHELRTPVTSIRGFLEIILNKKIDSAKQQEYLERAYSQTKTLSELIADMSLLTRIDEKQEVSELTAIDAKKLIERARTDVSTALEERQIQFSVDLPDDLIIQGNESLLYSVFRNLTDNVIRHAGEGVDIFIKVYEIKEGMGYFSFADTGKGIADEQHLNRLFERFYRVSEGRTRDTGGSGLGLSIVKNIIQLHGGTITVSNRKGHGLEFVFTLPVK